MKRSSILLISLVFLLCSTASFAQVKCGENDFKCQLDAAMAALKADPKNPENYFNLSSIFQKSGSHEAAIEGFTMYVSIPGLSDEYRADGYNRIGISHRAMKQPDLAYADFTKAIELAPENAIFVVNRGNANVDLGKSDLALADYKEALRIDPRSSHAYAQRGILYNALSRKDEAIQDFNKAIEFDPQNAEPYYNRGTIYFRNNQFDKAIGDYDKYISIIKDPVYLADGYLNRGIAHASLGESQKALNDLTKAIELRPDHPNNYKARALVYRALGKDAAAKADDLKAAQLLDPQKTSFDYALEGSRAFSENDYKGSIEPYQKALELEKKERKLEKNVWFLVVDNLAMAYGITGDIKNSRATLEYGISKEPSYPMFYYIMANTYGEDGDEANSIKWLRLAFERKANMIEGESFPDPMTDSSFKAFAKSESFRKAVVAMQSSN